MLDPNYIEELADGAEYVSADLHDAIINEIIKRITARLGRGDSYIFTPTDKWQMEVLEDAGYLARDIQKEIAKRTGQQIKVIRKAYEDAAVEQAKYDSRIYRKAGIDVQTDILMSPTFLRILQADYERTINAWENFTGTTLLKESYGLFITECNKAHSLVLSGAKGWSQAFMDAVDEISTNGVKVVYPTGHVDTVETATLRAIRTGVAQSCGKVTAVRAAENGVHLMLTSAHAGARPTHEPWQGQVFWVDWQELARRIGIVENIQYPEATPLEKQKYREFCLSTDIGTVTGLEGANCRHSYGPFFEGMQNPYEGMTFDPKQYEIDQRARLLERRIRHTKRELQAYNTAQTATTNPDALNKLKKAAERKNNLLTKQVSNYYAYCRANGIKPLESRLYVD